MAHGHGHKKGCHCGFCRKSGSRKKRRRRRRR